jgi:hypothetical protein
MEAVPDPVYLGVDNEPADMGEVLTFLAAELGLPRPASAPKEADGAPRADGTPGGTPSTGAEPSRGGNKRCSNARLRGTGFEFLYPSYREGYRAILSGVGVRHP